MINTANIKHEKVYWCIRHEIASVGEKPDDCPENEIGWFEYVEAGVDSG